MVIICSLRTWIPWASTNSITVAPAPTLSDSTYQRMRDMAIKMMRAIGNFAEVAMCSSPSARTKEIVTIEINPGSPFFGIGIQGHRLPIAKIAAKLAMAIVWMN